MIDVTLSGGAVDLALKAVSEGRRAYVLVNNRSEGNAPVTIQLYPICCEPNNK